MSYISGFIQWYFSVAAAVYILFVIKDAVNGFKAFKQADITSVIRGIGGCLIWPYILWHMHF